MDTKPNEIQERVTNGPGVRFRLAREASSMTLSQVANELNLTSEIISALEADDYNRLTNFTFVRGYLRSYSKLMKLPGDEIIQEFNRLDLIPTDGERALSVKMIKPASDDRFKIKSISYLISGLLFLLLLIFWFKHLATMKQDNFISLAEPTINQSFNDLGEMDYEGQS